MIFQDLTMKVEDYISIGEQVNDNKVNELGEAYPSIHIRSQLCRPKGTQSKKAERFAVDDICIRKRGTSSAIMCQTLPKNIFSKLDSTAYLSFLAEVRRPSLSESQPSSRTYSRSQNEFFYLQLQSLSMEVPIQVKQRSKSAELSRLFSSSNPQGPPIYFPVLPTLDERPLPCEQRLYRLDKRLVGWVTQTSPIMEQWEIYARVHNHMRGSFDSKWVMKRLHSIYRGKSTNRDLLLKCRVYNRLERIKNKKIRLDRTPWIKDETFG
ncbi:unnamed protein product [Blumeria hordei]|uniref:Uncharacterized protein n=1 Tax=Blumeria hordei TaxID=2867405 RepID=A0A383UN87_BLUHO|nr:unnamed protein product [Blumeria hordei]